MYNQYRIYTYIYIYIYIEFRDQHRRDVMSLCACSKIYIDMILKILIHTPTIVVTWIPASVNSLESTCFAVEVLSRRSVCPQELILTGRS